LLFRRGLLDQHRVVLSGGGAYAAAVRRACGELGADVAPLEADPHDEEAVAAVVAGLAEPPHALVVDAAAHFAGAASEELGPLRAAVDAAWIAARAVVNAGWIQGEGGKLVLVAPATGAGAHSHATRAALENLARTSSIEWSRYGIRPTTLLPGDATAPEAVGALVAYVISEAGDYFSGCAFSLDGPAPAG
jgi:NAD(P)-dependent dehydrogenase (short-subunit alcohol dehydrogenase family)